jgi:hypothetical protein
MNPQEVSIYKILVSIQHMIEDHNKYTDDYKYFRNIYNATEEGIDILMKDVGRRHLTESDFMDK